MDKTSYDSTVALADLLKKASDVTAEGISISSMDMPDMPLVYLNEGFERLTGYKLEEALGRNCRFLQGPLTEKVPVAKLRKAIEKGESCTVELLNYRKDGSTFWNRLSITPIHNQTGRITHYVGIQSDVTELKATKEKLELANLELRNFQNTINKELTQAKLVQRFILPAKPPATPHVHFEARFVPMEQIGGDFYDIITLKPNVYGIMIADVTGHGIPAALLTFMSSTTFKNIAFNHFSTAEVVRLTNERLYGRMPDDAFVSLFYAIYDAEKGRLTFTQAGHPPALLLRKKTKEIIELSTSDVLVGIAADDEVTFTEDTIELLPGDRLLLYTDAILETKLQNLERMDMDHFEEILRHKWDTTLEDLIEQLYQVGLEFSPARRYLDDFTMVAMEVLSDPS